MSLHPLSEQERTDALRTLQEWRYEDGALKRDLQLSSHPEAIAFLVEVAFIAEALNHHPETLNVWANLTFSLRTHDAEDQVTAQDVQLAREIEELWNKRGKKSS